MTPDFSPSALQTLYEVGQMVQAEEVDLDAVLSVVVRRTSELLHTDLAWVALADDDGKDVRIVQSWGVEHVKFTDIALAIGTGLYGIAHRKAETVVVEDYAECSASTPEFAYNMMVSEGVASVICAPMLRGSKLVGALYAANRSRTRFQAEYVSLISTLATQVSAAIRHAQMYTELERRNRLLERSFNMHRSLTAAGLRESGVDGIAETLARQVALPLRIEQEVVAPFSREHGGLSGNDDGDLEPLVIPIGTGEKYLGRIVVMAQELSELQKLALDQGATLIALELLKQRAARDVELRLRGELLDELLETSGEIPSAVAERAERLGVRIDVERRIVALQAEGGGIGYGELLATVRAKAGRRLHALDGSMLAVKRGSRVVLALAGTSADLEAAVLGDIAKAVSERDGVLAIGVSRSGRDLATAQREAVACLRLARRGRGPYSIVRCDDLGPLQFVLGDTDLRHWREVAREQLGLLVDEAGATKSPLLTTLRAYVEAEGNQQVAAASCFVHVNTIKYRLKKVRQILNQDLSDPEVRFRLRLAFKILDLLDALGLDGPTPSTDPGKVGPATTAGRERVGPRAFPDTVEPIRRRMPLTVDRA